MQYLLNDDFTLRSFCIIFVCFVVVYACIMCVCVCGVFVYIHTVIHDT
jgi:hypothetical protein